MQKKKVKIRKMKMNYEKNRVHTHNTHTVTKWGEAWVLLL